MKQHIPIFVDIQLRLLWLGRVLCSLQDYLLLVLEDIVGPSKSRRANLQRGLKVGVER